MTDQNGAGSTTNGNGHDRRIRLEAFTGYKSVIRADIWCNIFEVITHGKTDQLRIQALIEYLSGDALNWFGTDIAPAMGNISWAAVRSSLVTRFGTAVVNPSVAANHRRLGLQETVQLYYDDKMRLLRQTTLTETDIVAQLTDGMPTSYKLSLITARPADSVAWLNIALPMEAYLRSKQVPPIRTFPTRINNPYRPVAAAAATQGPSRFFSGPRPRFSSGTQNRFPNQPNEECFYCAKAGESGQMHWHRNCPRRNQQRQEEQQAAAAEQDQPTTSALSIGNQGNFLGGHY
jgi:hypothetical protein